MKYFSLDVETTGLNPDHSQILEVALVYEDSDSQIPVEELPKRQFYVTHKTIYGEPYALDMKEEIIDRICIRQAGYEYVPDYDVYYEMIDWMRSHLPKGKLLLAGKNVSTFDLRFLERLPNWCSDNFHHSSIDPTMFYMRSDDSVPPSLDACMYLAGLGRITKANDALEGARDVVRLIRKHFNITL